MKKLTHDHTLTKCLKVFIFSLMMLMPFLIFMPNAFYYGFNEHANQTADITTDMATAWQTVWSNSLFSWTNSSILKTPIDNFVNVFSITSDACISQYLVYLMTLTGIYVVIDIVLEMFIAMTHIFSKESK